jgi:dienelactone hydrolase
MMEPTRCGEGLHGEAMSLARRALGFVVFMTALAALNTQACAAVVASQPSSIAGPWHGRIAVAGVSLGIVVVFTETPDSGLSATIDIPQQGARGLALRHVTRDEDRVRFELPAGPGPAVFDGRLADGRISGSFTQAGIAGTFTLSPGGPEADRRAPAEPVPYREIEMTFTSGPASLAGTLTLPEGSGPFPAVAFLTGSGPQNRDEELFGFRPFRIIADHLTRRGIAVLRWDDRGVGGSTGAGPGITTKDLAGDALAALDWLASRDEIDGARVGLLGHSEGALAAAMAAAGSRRVGLIILLAGPALPGEAILRAQGEALARASGGGQAALDAVRRQQDLLFRAVRTGQGWHEVMDAARAGAAGAGQAATAPKIEGAQLEAALQAQMKMAKSGWYRFFLDYDPGPAFRKVSCPILALYGGLDTQVPAQPNIDALRAATAQGGNRDVTVKTYERANHLFIPATTGLPSEYATLEKTFVPGLLDDIFSWLSARVMQ